MSAKQTEHFKAPSSPTCASLTMYSFADRAEVWLALSMSGGHAYTTLTPAQARELAAALVAYADQVQS